MPQTFLLNASQIRALADYAASLRTADGDKVFVLATESDSGQMKLSHVRYEPGTGRPEGAVLAADTRCVNGKRPAVSDVRMAAGGRPHDLNKYDAVFWSEAAVEKFVLPYYASKSLWLAAHVVGVLSRKWYGYEPGVAGQTAAEDTDPPFALAHLPSSDYVDLSQPQTAPGGDLVLLSRDPSGQSVIEHRLAEFL
jgi:hypothetical protein